MCTVQIAVLYLLFLAGMLQNFGCNLFGLVLKGAEEALPVIV